MAPRISSPIASFFFGFIIFGWGNKKTKDRGETYPTHCSNCRNDVYYHLFRVSKRFTLFFIPVLPYSRKSYLTCPVCGASIELGKDERKKAKQLNEAAQDFLEDELGDSEFQEEIKEFETSCTSVSVKEEEGAEAENTS